MNHSADIEMLRNDALRKIGRNVVNFQKVEACLKYLIAISDVQRAPQEIVADHEKKKARLRRQPMGSLAKAFFESVYGTESGPSPPLDSSTIWLSTSFRVEVDASTSKERRRTLAALVTERNNLIHKELSGFDHNSVSSCTT